MQKLYDNDGWEANIMPIDFSIPMIRLGSCVQWFISDFARDSLLNLTHLKDLTARQDCLFLQSELSEVEILRIQRALFRFECLRYICQRRSDHMTTYDMIMQNRESLLKYDLDEIEEVACVRDYIIRRLWVIFDQIEDDLVQGAQAGLVPKVLQAVQLLPDSENWFGLHGKDNHIFFMEHMMFLGLSFLKDVLTADKERCTELILSASAGTTEFQDRFLTESLEELREIEHFESEPKFLSIMVHDESFFRDDLDTPSLGWRWINSKKIVYYAGDYAGKGPRDWGYIFWGRERLRASGIFDA